VGCSEHRVRPFFLQKVINNLSRTCKRLFRGNIISNPRYLSLSSGERQPYSRLETGSEACRRYGSKAESRTGSSSSNVVRLELPCGGLRSLRRLSLGFRAQIRWRRLGIMDPVGFPDQRGASYSLHLCLHAPPLLK
jgi:hypothetical protein